MFGYRRAFDNCKSLFLTNNFIISSNNNKTNNIPLTPISSFHLQSDSGLSEASKCEQLISHLRRANSPQAFEIFVEYLVDIQNTEALKIVSPTSQESLFKKMAENFRHKFPLGMFSGTPSPSSSRSTGSSSFQTTDSALSPFKERHQATLISSSTTSGGSSGSTINSMIHHQQQLNQTSFCGSSGSVASANRLPYIDIENVEHQQQTPPSAARLNFKLKPQNKLQQIIDGSTSQNPNNSPAIHRPHQELTTFHNLTLGEELQEQQMLSESEVPTQSSQADTSQQESVVCWHPYAQSSDAQSRASSPHYCNPSYASSVSSISSDSSCDSLGLDPNRILNPNVTMAIARDGLNVMRVKPASKFHTNFAEEYKMTARPRGPCLIVNNIDFEAEIFPTRKGSDEDARRFDDIFSQLGFTVIMRRNRTADQMKDLFKEVASKCKCEHDALFVIILSHGSEHGIYGTDGMEVHLEDEIISCFDNRNCKTMIGKPKVFVIQACRGAAKDYGGDGDVLDAVAVSNVLENLSTGAVPATSSSQENQVPDSWMKSDRTSISAKANKVAIRTDMLLVFSCLAGKFNNNNNLSSSRFRKHSSKTTTVVG